MEQVSQTLTLIATAQCYNQMLDIVLYILFSFSERCLCLMIGLLKKEIELSAYPPENLMNLFVLAEESGSIHNVLYP